MSEFWFDERAALGAERLQQMLAPHFRVERVVGGAGAALAKAIAAAVR